MEEIRRCVNCGKELSRDDIESLEFREYPIDRCRGCRVYVALIRRQFVKTELTEEQATNAWNTVQTMPPDKMFEVIETGNIGNGVQLNREYEDHNILTCSICGKRFPRSISNNAFPIRPATTFYDVEDRCCRECNDEIVVEYRTMLRGYEGKAYDEFIQRIQSMTYEELDKEVKERTRRIIEWMRAEKLKKKV